MKHFFNDTLLIYNESGRDEYGRASWGSGTAVVGRFVEKSKLLYNSKGETVMADALIHIPADTTIDVGSRIVYGGQDYRALKINKPKDQFSVRFIKVYLQVVI